MADQQEQIVVKEDTKKKGLLAFIRTNFFAGLFTVAPLFITFYVIKLVVQLLDKALSSVLPDQAGLSRYLPYDIFGVEFLVGAVVLIVIGMIARNVIGAKLLRYSEGILTAIPGVRSIYAAVKQVIEAVSASGSSSFREVVLVEYPRKGVWAIAFVTGETQGEVQRITDDTMVNVFLPTTPNPTSGFLLFVPRKELVSLHMTVDQGVKLVISAGIVTPTMAEGKAALKEQKEQAKIEAKEAKEAEKSAENGDDKK